jgi:hypothetical protein
MSIITINRGSYSRGKEVAEKLALKLGYECISRDILNETGNRGEVKIKELAMQVEGVEEVVFNAYEPKEQHNNVNPFRNI